MGIFDSIRRAVRTRPGDSYEAAAPDIRPARRPEPTANGSAAETSGSKEKNDYETFERDIFAILRTEVPNMDECFKAFREYIAEYPNPIPPETKRTLQTNMRDFVTARGYRASFETLDREIFSNRILRPPVRMRPEPEPDGSPAYRNDYQEFEKRIFSSLQGQTPNFNNCLDAFQEHLAAFPDPLAHGAKMALLTNMREFMTTIGYRASFKTLNEEVFLEGDSWYPGSEWVSRESSIVHRRDYWTFESDVFEILGTKTPNLSECIAAFKTYSAKFPIEIAVRTKRALLTNMRDFIYSRGYRASFEGLDVDVFQDRISRYSPDRLPVPDPENPADRNFGMFASRFAEQEFVSNFDGYCLRLVDRFIADLASDRRRDEAIESFIKLLALVGVYRRKEAVYQKISDIVSGTSRPNAIQRSTGRPVAKTPRFTAGYDDLDDSGFENMLGICFDRAGYQVEHTPYSHDMGADLIIRKNGRTTVIRARHTDSVGPEAIQQVVASMMYYEATAAMVITSGAFTQAAAELAAANHVILWERGDLTYFITNTE